MPMKPDLWTYADVIAHAIDYMGAGVDATTERFARRACQLALMEIMDKRTWTYFAQIGHINTVASYDTGTVEYTHATKTVTLTGGTWPTWAADGMIVIANAPYPIVSRTSGTAIVLSEGNNPGADIAAGATFSIARESYTLPVDFSSMGGLYRVDGTPASLQYLTPDQFAVRQAWNTGPSESWFYTITNDVNRHGVLALRFRPAPSSVLAYNFAYLRRPRAMRIDSYNTGTVTATSASTTITGNGTAWTAAHVGSLIRFAAQGSPDIPTGLSGANPAWLERAITGFISATQVAIDAIPGEDLTAVKYAISDPVDIETGAMMTYYLREVERQCRFIKRMDPASEDEVAAHKLSVILAFEKDNRRFNREAAGDGPGWVPQLLKYGHVLPDVN